MGVPKQTLDERGHLIASHDQADDAIACMADPRLIKTLVAGEESRVARPDKQRRDSLVLETLRTEIDPYLIAADATTLENLPLALRNVLVKNDHAEAGSST